MIETERVIEVSRKTVSDWLKKKETALSAMSETLIAPEPEDETATQLELYELRSFVFKKSCNRWIWVAICRRTRQVVSFVVGDRGEATRRKLWKQVPEIYKEK